MRPFERYDEEVLTRYSEWLLTLRDKKYTVIDAHAALLKHIEKMRKEEPGYRVSGDGIHPNANGHLVIALEILKELQAPAAVKDIDMDVTKEPPTKSDVKINYLRPIGAVSFSFTLPQSMPADPAWTTRAKEIEKFDEKFNRYSLKINGLRRSEALGPLTIKISKGKNAEKRVPIKADELARGIDLAELLKVSPDPKTPTIWKLIEEKNRILGPAWLTNVGHKRPDTPKGMPFEEARKKAAALDQEIRALCRPTEIQLEIGPFAK